MRRSIDPEDSPNTPENTGSTTISFDNTPITPLETYAALQKTPQKPVAVDNAQRECRRLQEQNNTNAPRDPSEAPVTLFQGTGLFGELILGGAVGRGQWSNVHRAWVGGSQAAPYCERGASPRAFAAKVAAGNSAVKVIRHEARILSHLARNPASSSYVLGFYGYDIKHCALVLEYLSPPWALQLHVVLEQQPSTLLGVAKGLIQGLDFLHGVGVIHGDIKPGNIFVRLQLQRSTGLLNGPDVSLIQTDESHETTYQPIYCDFSASRFDEPTAIPTESAGTYDFMAPELFSTSSQASFPTKASDVYALGVTLISVAAGKSPYHSASSCIAKRAMAMQGTPLEFLANDFKTLRKFDASGVRPLVEMAIVKDALSRCTARAWLESIPGA